MVGGFVAATVVTLLQYLRLRDRRLLLLAALFAFQAQALEREWYDVWRDVFQSGGRARRPRPAARPLAAAPAGAAAPPPAAPRTTRDRPAPEPEPRTRSPAVD